MAEVAAGQELEDVLQLQKTDNLRNTVLINTAYIDFIAGCVGGKIWGVMWQFGFSV